MKSQFTVVGNGKVTMNEIVLLYRCISKYTNAKSNV